MEALVKQNNAIDIYQEYFDGFATDHSAEVGLPARAPVEPGSLSLGAIGDSSCAGSRGEAAAAACQLHWHPRGSCCSGVPAALAAAWKLPQGMTRPRPP